MRNEHGEKSNQSFRNLMSLKEVPEDRMHGKSPPPWRKGGAVFLYLFMNLFNFKVDFTGVTAGAVHCHLAA